MPNWSRAVLGFTFYRVNSYGLFVCGRSFHYMERKFQSANLYFPSRKLKRNCLPSCSRLVAVACLTFIKRKGHWLIK